MAQLRIACGKAAQAPVEGGITGFLFHEDNHSPDQSYIYYMRFLQIDAVYTRCFLAGFNIIL